MSRYIEADKVLKELRLNHNDVIYIDKRDTAKRIEKIQGIDIVRCKECIHFTQGGWCDREFDWFPVDGNDFCSMAERMEVQDG